MQIDQFVIKFIEEATDLINNLEGVLLENENDKTNQENVNQIFRVMHTLKGVSGMYGFEHISNLTHDLETIFDLIRCNKIEFTDTIFNTTLKTVDQFRNILEDKALDNKQNKDNQDLLLKEIELLKEEIPCNTTPCLKKDVIVNKPGNIETFYIVFKPDESILNRGINILRIFEELADIGEFRIVNHSFKEHDSNENQKAWGIYLITDKGINGIEEIFMFVLDDTNILKVSPYNLFRFKEFVQKLDDLQNNQKEYEPVEQPMDAIKKINDTISLEDIQETAPVENENNLTDQPEEKDIDTEDQSNTIISKQNITSRISIDASKLDRLMYLVSELVTTKSQLTLAVARKDNTSLISIAEKIENLSQAFRDNALNIRLVPVAEMITPFKRLVRDLSKELGKKVNFITQGIETELDKNIIDRLSEPVMHILRNCVDHGIETPNERETNNKTPEGNIKFTSFYSGANVFIQIQDDGCGLDVNKIKNKAIETGLIKADDNLSDQEIYELIFQPGFSTATRVTDVSGRGVGMDIVKRKIEEVRGEVEINSEKGLGTFFTIKLHQTLSIIDTLLVAVEDTHYLIPVSDIEFCEQACNEDLYNSLNKQVEINQELIPYISLRELFKETSERPIKEKLIIINKNDKKIALVADKIIGEHQAVLKPLGELFRDQQFLSGASMLGDGSLALMLDTNKMTNKSLIEQL